MSNAGTYESEDDKEGRLVQINAALAGYGSFYSFRADEGKRKKKTFLDLLMDLSLEETKFTDEELMREEVDTMMIAGNDATATIIIFVLLMVATFPEIQVYEELCKINGKENPTSQPISHEDLPRMQYLELVIKETIRLFPVGPVLFRRITDDLAIDHKERQKLADKSSRKKSSICIRKTNKMSISSLLTVSFIFIGLTYVLVHYLKNLRFYREAARFPGPPAYPLIGNVLSLIGIHEDIADRWSKICDAYTSPFRFWIGNQLHYIVYDPEQLKTILLSSKALEKHPMVTMAVPWLGEGLLTSPAIKWRIHRKLINPVFNQKLLESFVEIFAAQSEIMVEQMKIEIDRKEFDIFNYISLCNFDVMCETLLGIPSKSQIQRTSPYIENAVRLPQIIAIRLTKIWLYPDMIFFRTKLGKEQLFRTKFVHTFVDDLIQKKKQMIEVAKNRDGFCDQNEGKRKPFLELLIELTEEGTVFTEKELRDEVNTMVLAGFDSMATTFSFVTLMLASHPEVQEKIYDELCEIYGSENPASRPVRQDDLPKMKYLELVIKETMRIFPIGPVLFKSLSDDIKIGKYTLTKGSSLFLPILKTHRSEEYWKDPLEFIPERFLPEECAKRHPYSYIPFSAGSRNCIGGKYAMMLMKVTLATIVRNYVLKKDNIQPIADIKLKSDVSIKPMEPIKIKIERRVIKY